MTLSTKKKLLVLDVNGLLVERVFRADKRPEHRSPDGQVGKFYVYKRPYCKEFLTFCFENFEVGLWSSAQQHNVQNLVDFVFGDLKSKLAFTWNQSDCTDTGLRTLENKMKPVYLKELSKLWSKQKPDLPWEEGYYGPFNTLLIDDTPYKAMRNPPHTAIFPDPYEVSNEPDDALGGALLKYLEGIAGATNVQDYVKDHPFGQLPISKESPQWYFYCNILRLPTVNQISSSNVETNVEGVANETLLSIAYNNGSTKISSSQRCSVPSIEREDDGLTETAMNCVTERNGTLIITSTQNGLEENGVTKTTKPRKRRRNSVIESALNQELEAHTRSAEDKEAAFGISQQSDHDIVSKDDGWSDTAVTFTTKRIGAIVSTTSHKKPAISENKNVDSQTNKYHVGNNTLKRSVRGSWDARCSNRGYNDKASHFNQDYRDCSNHRQSYNFHTNTRGSRTCHLTRKFEGSWRHKNDANASLQTQAFPYVQTNPGGSRTSQFPRKSERNWRHETYANSSMAQAGNFAQTNTGGIQASQFPRKYEINRRHLTDANSTIQTHVAHAGPYAQTNTGGIQASQFPENFEENWRHQNDANATFQTQVVQDGTYANKNAFGRSVVPEYLVGYPGGGYTNGGHYQSWPNRHSHFWDGSNGSHYQNHNRFCNPPLFPQPYSKANHTRRQSNDRKTHRSNNRYQ